MADGVDYGSTSLSSSPPVARFPGKCCDAPGVRYGGRVGGPVAGLDCEQPIWLCCVGCGAVREMRCDSSQAGRCSPCARRYRARVRSLVRDGMEYVPAGRALMLTITAPSDRGRHCRRHRRCGGEGPECDPCPCTAVGGVDLGEWNQSYTARANRVLEAIRRGEASQLVNGVRRRLQVEYFHGREVQKRGALHGHIVLMDLAGGAIRMSRRLLRELLVRHGFGHELQLDRIGTSRHQGSKSPSTGRVAGYVAKYVSKAADSRDQVPWPAVPRRRQAPYRTWTRSRGWPSSMKEVKARQVAWAIGNADGAASAPGRDDASPPVKAGDGARPPLDSNTEYYATACSEVGMLRVTASLGESARSGGSGV